jgi:hypothetical protein
VSRLARALVLASLILAGCNDGGEESPDEAATPPSIDAAAAIAPTPGADAHDGGSAAAHDGDAGAATATDKPGKPGRPRRVAGADRSILVLTLRSTPTGAMASVDGTPIGRTPTFWETEFDGREHEFTFTMAGYAMERRLFVPTTSGHVHGTLVKITAAAGDAGLGLGEATSPPPPPR